MAEPGQGEQRPAPSANQPPDLGKVEDIAKALRQEAASGRGVNPNPPSLKPEEERQKAEIIQRRKREQLAPVEARLQIDPQVFRDYDPSPHERTALSPIFENIKLLGEGAVLSERHLEDAASRIADLAGGAQITREQARDALDEVRGWMSLAREAEAREAQEARRRGGLDPNEVLIVNGINELRRIKEAVENRPDKQATPEEQETLRTTSEEVRNAISLLPLSRPDMSVIREIARDEEMSDYFQNRIIGVPDNFPDTEYNKNIDFYSKSTLIAFYAEVQKRDPDRAKRYASIEEARESIHNIQYALTKGEMEFFSKLAFSVTNNTYDSVVSHVGVPTVNRLYEEAFWSVGLSQKTTLQADDFDKMEKWVRERVGKMNEQGSLANNQFGYSRQLERWELERALTVGLNFFTVKIRGAELIASTAVENSGGARQWGSYKYESAVRLVNPVRFLLHKFDAGGVGGGQWIGLRLMERLEKQNDKLGKNQLPFIGKIRRELFETSSPLGQVGLEWGWRIYMGYFNSLPLRLTKAEYDEQNKVFAAFKKKFPFVEGEDLEIVGQEGNSYYVRTGEYMDRWLNFMKNFKDPIMVNGNSDCLSKVIDIQGDWKSFVERKFAPIAEQVDFYKGILVSQAGKEDIPEETRAKLWEKTAKFLPLRIGYFLSGERDEILRRRGMDPTGTAWNELEGKIAQLQELRVLKAEEAVRKFNINEAKGKELWEELAKLRQSNDLLAWYEVLSPEEQGAIGLNAQDKNIVRDLINLGNTENAKYLNKVNWPYAAFLEDAIFNINYSKLGPEFSRRRIVDAVQYSKAGQSLLAAIQGTDKPLEDMMKHFEEAIEALSAPMPKHGAQERVYPIILTILEFRQKFKIDRIPIISGIRKLLKRNQSKAQEYLGHTAPADDTDDQYQITQVMTRRGILRRGGKDKYGRDFNSLLEKMRHELGAQFVNYAFFLIKTFGPIALFILPIEFIKALRLMGGDSK